MSLEILGIVYYVMIFFEQKGGCLQRQAVKKGRKRGLRHKTYLKWKRSIISVMKMLEGYVWLIYSNIMEIGRSIEGGGEFYLHLYLWLHKITIYLAPRLVRPSNYRQSLDSLHLGAEFE